MSWDTTVKRRRAPVEQGRPAALRLLFGLEEGGVAAGEPWELQQGVTPVGRAVGEAGLALVEDPRVSRRHAEVRRSGEGVFIEDVSSTGTFVNGRPVSLQMLADGDVVRVGDTFLLFRQELDRGDPAELAGLLGDSAGIRQLRRTLKLVAPSMATVLLLGETGTGKEVAARALHHESGRSGPLVALNCGALPESLAESQLFGHVAGAFSGARKDEPGFFRAAHGGTLLLDEVGELPPAIQPKLLRALEERAVVPVGATRPVSYDARIVAATNRPLVAAVGCGGFRSDLYARLSEFAVELPPLRTRREDILPILMAALGAPVPALDPELVQALLLHPWPFNVRELVKVATQLRVRAAGADLVTLGMFEPHLRHSLPQAFMGAGDGPDVQLPAAAALAMPAEPAPGCAPGSVAASAEPHPPIPTRAELEAMLSRFRGVVADVARETGRSRKQVYRWIHEHDLDLARFRE